MRRILTYLILAVVTSLMVGLIGAAIAPDDASTAVWVGVGIALALQVLFVGGIGLVFARKPLLAHGLGMLGRLSAIGLLALFWVPMSGHPAAPLMFSLVAVFFVTTLLEPVFLIRPSPTR